MWILARACWDYAGLRSVQDAYLQAVKERLQELDPVRPVPAFGLRAVLARGSVSRGGPLKSGSTHRCGC